MAHVVQSGRRMHYEIDMVHGPMFGKLLVFSLPLMLSGVLQLLFNAADIIIVGRFNGANAIAAVGSTTSLVNLMISIFMGLSVGVNVLVAQSFGAEDEENCREVVRASAFLSVSAGFLLACFGFILSDPVLKWMGTPKEVLLLSSLYLKIFFLGMPFTMFYNFGSAVLRGVGDTGHPLIYLLAAGLLNVLLNLMFVVWFRWGVAGVALATVLSQILSAALVLFCLLRYEGMIRLTFLNEGEESRGFVKDFLHSFAEMIKYRAEKFGDICKIGLPAGIQTALFSISNVIIQSSVNSFGSTVMAGNAAAQNLEGFVYISMNALMQAGLTFTSANYGAREKKRVLRVLFLCLFIVTAIGIPLGHAVFYFGRPLLSVYTAEEETVACGLIRLSVIATHYYMCGVMDTGTGCLRGIGYSFLSMMLSMLGSCVFRIIWVMTAFRVTPTLEILYLSYPISWLITAVAQIGCFFLVKQKAFGRWEKKERLS